MKKLALFTCALALLAAPAFGATITIVNQDGPNEGFNDNTPAAPVGGNPGTTIGEQRLNLFDKAAEIWGALLPSAVEIRVQAQFNPQSCNASSAVLGSAGPIEVFRDFAGAEFALTWYHVALANRLNGSDLSGANDINTTFNSSIDNNNNCLDGTNWYYGFDGNEGSDVELLPVLLHELGHGLGFSEFTNLSTGAEFNGFTDIYARHILDNTTGLTWNNMSNGQRAASAINSGNVVWNGTAATVCSPDFLGGTPMLFNNVPNTLPATMEIGLASFGPQPTNPGVTGNVVLVDDGFGTTSDACEPPLVNAGAINGNIALIDRGTCSFASKAEAAQAAGAIAVIIANNVGTGAIGLGGSSGTVTIPTVSVSLADGNLLKAELGNGLNVTIGLDTLMLAGADSNNRVKLYAPNPIEGGSSISHWDTSANPSLLMEPSITGGLSSDVDLTIKHFEDIGWLTTLATDTPTPKWSVNILEANRPNPFNPQTTIEFTLRQGGHARLEIFDVKGRHVKTLVSGTLSAGPHRVTWNGTNQHGNQVVSGVYMYRLKAGDFEQTRQMLLLK